MYSIFLPFAAIVIDLCVAYIYFKVFVIISTGSVMCCYFPSKCFNSTTSVQLYLKKKMDFMIN